MNNTLNHKCPKCDADLKFNPKGQNWICDFCRNSFNIEDFKSNSEILTKNFNDGIVDVYKCSNCGAEVIADSNTIVTSCVYCRSTTVLKDKLQGEFHPDYLIPFKNTKEDAIIAFKKLKNGRILMPKEFNNPNNIKEMSGVYIPFWLYDYDTVGEIDANCDKVSTWESGNYKYTKTDTYKVVRGGKMSFESVPVDGSKKFKNDIMNSIEPFDYKALKEFNYSYLSGFLAEKYDVTKEEAEEDSIERIKNSFEDEMKGDIFGYDSISVTNKNININKKACYYVLLPVWMLNIKYKNKTYTFAMNGQTGKIVGNIPIDKKKSVMIWLSIFIIFFIIILFLFKLGGVL